MAEQEIVDRVEKCLRELSEHFSSVQIFVSREDEDMEMGTTAAYTSGKGSWFARLGQIDEWRERVRERNLEYVRRNPDDPDL